MHIYEYLFTAIIIVLILLSSSTMISTISEPSHSTSEKEQLKVTAQKIMTQILLDPGNPPEWGSDVDLNENNLKTFGLAKYSETTREAYVLDTDKVLRLDESLLSLSNTYTLYISPSRAIDILNLGYDYGFQLKLYPALNITIRNPSPEKYNIHVASEYAELPIVNANVTAKMYYYNNVTKKIESQEPTSYDPSYKQTSIQGNCNVTFSSAFNSIDMKMLSIVIDYYGIHVIKEYIPNWTNVIQAHLIGDYLFLDQTYSISNSATEVIVNKKSGRYAIENVASTPTYNATYKGYNLYVEPSTATILAVTQDGTKLVFASRDATLTYSTIPGVQSLPFAYSIERSVLISGSAYVMQLYIWRMSW